MNSRTPNRFQRSLLPPAVEDYVLSNDPVRFYDAFVESLNLEELGIVTSQNKLGTPEYDPKTMIKILLYSYSYGFRSCRKIERALHHNLSFRWLAGDIKPNFRTIARFRKENADVITQFLKKTGRVCLKLNLIEGNVLFADGTKIRANASIDQSFTAEKLEKKLAALDKKIDDLMQKIETIDEIEATKSSLVEMHKELGTKEKLKEKISQALADINKSGKKRINLTDKDSLNFKSRQGAHAGYNAQVVTDEKHGLIVHAQTAEQNTDIGLLNEVIEQANQNLGEKHDCQTACADSGYYKVDDLKALGDKGIEVIVPSQRQACHQPQPKSFTKEAFIYDEKSNTYTCPAGHQLDRIHYQASKKADVYRIKGKSPCPECIFFGQCTSSPQGRTINRMKNEVYKQQCTAVYASPAGQRTYKRRKEVAELPFGYIKRTLNGGHFLVKGVKAVNAELSLMASCFNIRRLITILGGVEEAISFFKTQFA